MSRPNKYGSETKIVPTRVPIDKIPDFKKKVSDILKSYEVVKPNAYDIISAAIRQVEKMDFKVTNACDCYFENGLFKRGKSKCKLTKVQHNF